MHLLPVHAKLKRAVTCFPPISYMQMSLFEYVTQITLKIRHNFEYKIMSILFFKIYAAEREKKVSAKL